MRRLIFISAFVIAIAVVSASGQMRGMGRPGGSMRSHGFGRGVFVGGVPPRMGFHSGAGFRHRFVPGFGFHGFGAHPCRFGVHGCGPFFGFHRRFFFNNGLAYPVVFVGGTSYPLWADPSFVQYSSDMSAQSYDRERQQLYEDIQNLREEVRALREERESTAYAAPPPAPAPRARPEPPTEAAATVLVFRDGRRIETRNYAIAGQTLWIFNERRATKFPLVDLDVEATTKVNEGKGIDFRLPRQ